ncbi:MAG: ABC transporter substrate-binding protein [Myxococcota bacterium]
MTPILLTILLTGCTGTPPQTTDGQIPIRLALNWFPEPEFGGYYAAMLSGHYEKAGFDVTILPGGPGAPSLELLSTGRAEAAISAADDLLVKRSRGINAVGVFPALQFTPVGVMVHRQANINRFEDITDGQIAIEIGSPFQQFLWNRFEWDGKVEPVPYGGSVAAFLADPSHRQQAYITSEPCIAKGKGADIVFLRGADAGWNPYAALLTLPEPLPDWADAFIEATHNGWAEYQADPTAVNVELARLNDQLTPELLTCITQAQAPFVVGEDGMGQMTAKRWQTVAETLTSLGVLEGNVDVTGAWSMTKGATKKEAP